MFDQVTNDAEILRRNITDSCERVSARLSAVSGIDISVVIASDTELRTAHYDWQPRPFDWVGSAFDDCEYFCNFRLAVRGNGKLSGVRKVSFDKEEGSETLVLNHVRANPDSDNPLKGFVLDIFAEASLDIAKSLDAQEIIVEKPRAKIIPIYKSLGFSYRPNPMHLGLHVREHTKLNPRVFDL